MKDFHTTFVDILFHVILSCLYHQLDQLSFHWQLVLQDYPKTLERGLCEQVVSFLSQQLPEMRVCLHPFTYPWPARVVKAPQMTSQPVSSIVFSVLHHSPELNALQACPFPDVLITSSVCITRWVSDWILTSRQTNRVSSGQSNSITSRCTLKIFTCPKPNSAVISKLNVNTKHNAGRPTIARNDPALKYIL